MNAGLRFWRTVRWLRPAQIIGRIGIRLYRPRPACAPPPDVRAMAARWKACSRCPSAIGPETLRLLNVEHRIASAADWNNSAWPKLWLYNAHYFDDLVATNASARTAWHRALVARWVEENPPADGVGWESYPTSLRIVNWVKWAWSGNVLDLATVHSLAVQARWLRKRLEWHLLGNHLWANAKALVFAGMFFEGTEADAWLDKGLALIDRELAEQLLPDGGHFERSPMYHAIVLEDLLDLVQLGSQQPQRVGQERIGHWRQLATRMQRWLWTMTHPDGGIGFFNDATLGIAPEASALETYARDLGLSPPGPSAAPLQPLADSGYVRLQSGPAVLIADVGEIGPDYLPGHAHADTLSFELSLDHHRVLVNGGISLYEAVPERLHQRGTAAHTALQLDGHDSSEVWSSFRVGRRARPIDVEWEQRGEGGRVRAGHDGYRWRPGRPVHHREWALSPRQLKVIDTVTGRFSIAVARFHLHPDWSVHLEDDGRGQIEGHGRRVSWWTVGAGHTGVSASAWHPAFGVTLSSQMLFIEVPDGHLETFFCWE